MEDPVTRQMEILAGAGATRMAFTLAVLNQLRQWPWGRIAATPAALAAIGLVRSLISAW